MHDDSGDWLFGYHKECNQGNVDWDVGPSDAFSIVVSILIFLGTVAFTVAIGLKQKRALAENGASVDIQKKQGYQWHLDFGRIVCVACVVAEHAGGSGRQYSRNNVVFVLHWVMQYLLFISGTAMMLSRSPLGSYILRLSVFFLLGVIFNTLGMQIAGVKWWEQPGNMVFQMFYVAFLIILSVATWPLRWSLKWRHENPLGNPHAISVASIVFFGAVVIFGFVLLVIDADINLGFSGKVTESIPRMCFVSVGLVTVALLGTCFPPHNLLSWILLPCFYVPRITQPVMWASFPHIFEIYIWALVVQSWGLSGKDQIARWFRAYWPIVLAVLMLFSTPAKEGRCDYFPSESAWVRFRFYFIELVLLLAFASGSMNTSDPARITKWLNVWALFAYLTHMLWWRCFGNTWGPAFSYGSAGFFYISVSLATKRNEKYESDSDAKAEKSLSHVKTLSMTANITTQVVIQRTMRTMLAATSLTLDGDYLETDRYGGSGVRSGRDSE